MRTPVTLRRDRRGVSELIGTMLILSMTVVLFASIIIWVNSFPAPTAAVRLDFEGSLSFDLDATPTLYANLTIVHKGGDPLDSFATRLYLRVRTSGGSTTTTELRTIAPGYGLQDSPDNIWSTGEHWNMRNYTIVPSDTVQVLIADRSKNLLLWDQVLKATTGNRPPVFLEKYGDRTPATVTIDTPKVNTSFRVMARVTDLDGDLNASRVYVAMTFYSPTAYKMRDDGTSGDVSAGDGLFTSSIAWWPPSTAWDDGPVRLNATDLGGRTTVAWFNLEVILNDQRNDSSKPPNDGGTGVPTNFICNGDSCYNIFWGDEWDANWRTAPGRRIFVETKEVVVAILTTRIKDPAKPQVLNNFLMYDPFATTVGTQHVVYNSNKQVTAASEPSSSDAFRWDNETNGYFLYIHRFKLNGGLLGNWYFSDACPVPGSGTHPHPPNYCFTHYSITLEIKGTLPALDPPESKYFKASTQITVTDLNGNYVNYPSLATYSTSAFSAYRTQFNSTEKIYAAVNMSSTDGTDTSVFLGNVVISDFVGGQQINRAPVSGRFSNSPVCPVTLACTSANSIITIAAGPGQYRFMIDLAQATQDPWLEGTQTYTISVLLVRDSNEVYNSPISLSIVIRAPIYKLDLVDGSEPLDSNAWGSRDTAYYYENLNGVDRWRQNPPLESGPPPPDQPGVRSVRFGNLDGDTDLDIVVSKQDKNNDYKLYWYRRDVDANQNTIWTRYRIESTSTSLWTDIDIGDLTREGMNDIATVQGSAIYYYLNDGLWTKRTVDAAAGTVNAIRLGDVDGDGDLDIVSAVNGRTLRLYRNDGFGNFPAGGQSTYTLGSPPSFDAVSVDTGDQNADGYADVIVGASNGNLYRLIGGAGGLSIAGNPYATPTGSVVGVKFVEIASSQAGMEVMAASGSSIRMYEADSTYPATLIATITLAGPYAGHSISSLAAGDFDDDADDDFAVATTGTNIGEILYYRNTNGATGASWDAARLVDDFGDEGADGIYEIDAGDADKGLVGR